MQLVQQLFSIFDVKAGTYSPPLCANNIQEMLRIFGDLVRNPNMKFNAHPEDYRLFRVGEMSLESANVVAAQTPQFIIAGSDLLGPQLMQEEA